MTKLKRTPEGFYDIKGKYMKNYVERVVKYMIIVQRIKQPED